MEWNQERKKELLSYLCSFEFCSNGCRDGNQAEEKDGSAAADDGRPACGLFHWALQIEFAGTKPKLLCGNFVVVGGGAEEEKRKKLNNNNNNNSFFRLQK